MVLKDQGESGRPQNTCSLFTKSQRPHVVLESEKITIELKTYNYTTLHWKGFSGKVFGDFEAFIGVIALLCAISFYVLSFFIYLLY